MMHFIGTLTSFAVGVLFAGGFMAGLGFPVPGLALAALGSGWLGILYGSLLRLLKTGKKT